MTGLVNKLLILDMIILVVGMVVLYVRPFGWDMTYGIVVIAVSFVASIILFLLKLQIWERKKETK